MKRRTASKKRADKAFVVLQVRRRDLARDLNEYLQDGGDFPQCRKFKSDDRRLTDDACRKFALAVAAAVDASRDGGEEAGEEVVAEFLHDFIAKSLKEEAGK